MQASTFPFTFQAFPQRRSIVCCGVSTTRFIRGAFALPIVQRKLILSLTSKVGLRRWHVSVLARRACVGATLPCRPFGGLYFPWLASRRPGKAHGIRMKQEGRKREFRWSGKGFIQQRRFALHRDEFERSARDGTLQLAMTWPGSCRSIASDSSCRWGKHGRRASPPAWNQLCNKPLVCSTEEVL